MPARSGAVMIRTSGACAAPACEAFPSAVITARIPAAAAQATASAVPDPAGRRLPSSPSPAKNITSSAKCRPGTAPAAARIATAMARSQPLLLVPEQRRHHHRQPGGRRGVPGVDDCRTHPVDGGAHHEVRQPGHRRGRTAVRYVHVRRREHAAPSRQTTVYARHADTRACGALLTAGRRGAVWPGTRSSPGA